MSLANPAQADVADQVELLKDVFARPVSEWSERLAQDQALLDSSFFENIKARIAWSQSHRHWNDAVRFAMVGELSAKIVGREENLHSLLASSTDARSARSYEFQFGDLFISSDEMWAPLD